MRILLLSAYDAVSHRYWHEGLTCHLKNHEWKVLNLPDRHFSWRIRGNSLTWSFGQHRETLSEQWDLLIATSMVDLSSLRGMTPTLSNVPTVFYFHENQFCYPRSEHQKASVVEIQLQSIYSALCADKLVFNSDFNKSTFFIGAEKLLKKLPDHVPKGLIELLHKKSTTLPVPIQNDIKQESAIQTKQYDNKPISIAWAARWEYDKGPDRLLEILNLLSEQEVDFSLCIMGQGFRKTPKEFTAIKSLYSERIVQFGFVQSRNDYLRLLKLSDIILSTSYHEFQGVSVMEAAALGATPVLPYEQAYPDFFDHKYLYKSNQQAVEVIKSISENINKKTSEYSAPNMDDYLWETMKQRYETLFEEVANSPK